MGRQLRVLTRRSKLARIQTDLAVAALRAVHPDWSFEVIPMQTQGDQRLNWSLETAGGKGLFTSELERAIVQGEGDLAVHSAKDLPTEMAHGVVLAGFLPRAPVHDVLVLRADAAVIRKLATSSPRRRVQMSRRFPEVEWCEVRGNVETRLRKIVEGHADGTILASAGLQRLGIRDWKGLVFEDISIEECLPAAGQGAIGLQCRPEDAESIRSALCADTARAVGIERAALQELGGGCHSASAVHLEGQKLHVYHDPMGRVSIPATADPDEILAKLRKLIEDTNHEE